MTQNLIFYTCSYFPSSCVRFKPDASIFRVAPEVGTPGSHIPTRDSYLPNEFLLVSSGQIAQLKSVQANCQQSAKQLLGFLLNKTA